MNKIPVEVAGITGSAQYQGYVVILKEKEGNRLLPIFIGTPEAHNINFLLTGLRHMRPLTFDLFNNILELANVRIEEVTITKLEENTFFAEIIFVIRDGEVSHIDARPSDAIALAIKTDCPIFINDKVLAEAGFQGNETVKIDDNKNDALNEQIILLTQQLNMAVEKEEFEHAAKIRDKIKELEDRVKSELF